MDQTEKRGNKTDNVFNDTSLKLKLKKKLFSALNMMVRNIKSFPKKYINYK